MSLSIGVLLRNPEKEEVAARVKVPKELLRRFLSIGDGLTFVPLEEVISPTSTTSSRGWRSSITRCSG